MQPEILVYEIFQLIQRFGSQENLARRLGVDPARISQLLNGKYITRDLAEDIEILSQGKIPAEQLLKYCGRFEKARQVKQYKRLAQKQVIAAKQPSFLLEVSLLTIEQTDRSFVFQSHPIEEKTDMRPLLINEDNHLIFSTHSLQWLQANKVSHIKVLVVNLSRLLEEGILISPPYPLTILERMAIGLALEYMLDKQIKEQNKGRKDKKNAKSSSNWNSIIKRKANLVVNLCGIQSTNSYFRLKRVVKQGTPELLKVLARKCISIYRASEIAHLPSSEQAAALAQISTLKMEKQL